MMPGFTTRLCNAVAECSPRDAQTRRLIGRAVADTVGVAAAGFLEPVTQKTLSAYRGSAARTWSGDGCESAEAAIMVDAIAAHALDFDDVFLESHAHVSAVIVPAVLRTDEAISPDALVASIGAGLIAARAVAQRLGSGHYHKGWHATGTIGAFAATAALGRLKGLREKQLADAFALAGSLSGGLKINFGSQAKPAHAGFAAAAGYRAVRLALAGVDGAPDVFAEGGYIDLYGTGDGAADAADFDLSPTPHRVSVKLYPCCYASHRLIGIALDAYGRLGPVFSDSNVGVNLRVPKNSIDVLTFDRPVNGTQAKFSAPFTVAVALLYGSAGLLQFSDEMAVRPEVVDLMQRIVVVEETAIPSHGDIRVGQVTLTITGAGGKVVGRFNRSFIPGSPEEPPLPAILAGKITECINLFVAGRGFAPPILEQCRDFDEVAEWLEPRAAARRSSVPAVF